MKEEKIIQMPNEKAEDVARENLKEEFNELGLVTYPDGKTDQVHNVILENDYYQAFVQPGYPDPFVEFEGYVRQSVGWYGGVENRQIPIETVRQTVAMYKSITDAIRNELFQDDEKLVSVDRQLTVFFKNRIDHFLKTLGERIHHIALIQAELGTESASYLEQTMKAHVPSETLHQDKQEVEAIMQDRDIHFKAAYLAQIVRNIHDQMYTPLESDRFTDPLAPETYQYQKAA